MLLIASSGSLAATARALNVTPSAVTQRLNALESRIGVQLVDRAGRSLSLTDEGDLLVQRGAKILDELTELVDSIGERKQIVSGCLRILAPLGFGRRHVAPIAAAFKDLYPRVTIELSLSDELGRHPAGAWDIAVHVGPLPNTGLMLHRLVPNRRILCASPDYVARNGVPEQPADLKKMDCIALRENHEDVTLWRFEKPACTVRIDPILASNDGEVVRLWALCGLGIMLRSEWDVAEDLASGALVSLLPDWQPPDADVMALLGSRRGRSARTQAFLEFLKCRLNPPPWRANLKLMAGATPG